MQVTPIQDDMFTPDVIADPYSLLRPAAARGSRALERGLRAMGGHSI